MGAHPHPSGGSCNASTSGRRQLTPSLGQNHADSHPSGPNSSTSTCPTNTPTTGPTSSRSPAPTRPPPSRSSRNTRWKGTYARSLPTPSSTASQLTKTTPSFRLFPAASGILRVAPAATTITDGPRTAPVPANSTLFLSFVSASLDATVFPDPLAVDLDRPASAYIHHGWGAHACLGRPVVTAAAAAMLRVFARECGAGLRRAPGAQGVMKRKMFNGAFPVFLAEDGGEWESFPVGLKVLFDEGEGGAAANGGVVGNGSAAAANGGTR